MKCVLYRVFSVELVLLVLLVWLVLRKHCLIGLIGCIVVAIITCDFRFFF